ncbi:right-handed parallel beta-helix repeat-containing protein [Coraliomargarita sp. SDUM461004]|uniref:Right-handed parallel beta-helix repeat-containing protein n=2 Tax=Thalassobacterium sedimentorum TaxID=3041258 RepID=A0ABU1ADU1_9BACT|nr:right-handed parallel beta-helix repeat-containing protein [Coraliomargarita sp. SDUM461004]
MVQGEEAKGLKNVSIENCEIANSGGHGIWIGEGASDVTIRQCHLHDLLGGGIYIGGGWGVKDAYPTTRVTIDNNFYLPNFQIENIRMFEMIGHVILNVNIVAVRPGYHSTKISRDQST